MQAKINTTCPLALSTCGWKGHNCGEMGDAFSGRMPVEREKEVRRYLGFLYLKSGYRKQVFARNKFKLLSQLIKIL